MRSHFCAPIHEILRNQIATITFLHFYHYSTFLRWFYSAKQKNSQVLETRASRYMLVGGALCNMEREGDKLYLDGGDDINRIWGWRNRTQEGPELCPANLLWCPNPFHPVPNFGTLNTTFLFNMLLLKAYLSNTNSSSANLLWCLNPFHPVPNFGTPNTIFLHTTWNRMRVAIESGKGMKVKVLK